MYAVIHAVRRTNNSSNLQTNYSSNLQTNLQSLNFIERRLHLLTGGPLQS